MKKIILLTVICLVASAKAQQISFSIGIGFNTGANNIGGGYYDPAPGNNIMPGGCTQHPPQQQGYYNNNNNNQNLYGGAGYTATYNPRVREYVVTLVDPRHARNLQEQDDIVYNNRLYLKNIEMFAAREGRQLGYIPTVRVVSY